MSDIQKLEELSVDELLQELIARGAKAEKSFLAVPLEPSENLREFNNETIIEVLRKNQKVIYGTDDRLDVFQLPPTGPTVNDADSVVALFDAANVINNGNGTSTLQTQNFGTARNLCASEPFRNQPIGAFCSGFLVAQDVVATAGHCVDAGNVTNVRFVFGFRMQNVTTAQTVIDNGEIYSGVAVIARQEVGNGPDWALVRIDRPVTNHRIARIRQAGKIRDGQAVHVIGHPVGLPTKVAGNAVVRDNTPNAFFVANLDTYGGNSGSPVINSNTHEVEGILVRGETDFVQNGACFVSLVCPDNGCRGEDCTRTTEFAQLVPFEQVYAQGDPGNGIGGYDLKSSADRAFAFDYDGSGKLDHLALYRPGTGTIWILRNSGGSFTPVYAQGDPGNGIGGYDLKSSADRAFAFDYDGSGKLDHLALYRPGTGTIWILRNSGGSFTPVYAQGDPGNGIGGYDLKSSADRAFAFDYDGSGKLDHLALYRPGTGTIWILRNRRI
ncbi:hypothetical protein C7B80_33180 [Cyanosarcina cf. burmensis CCALA 770]|nr:hypothetical protein C7B80_33180 [Cyanosarcina cf. burmensis CCALA 770]